MPWAPLPRGFRASKNFTSTGSIRGGKSICEPPVRPVSALLPSHPAQTQRHVLARRDVLAACDALRAHLAAPRSTSSLTHTQTHARTRARAHRDDMFAFPSVTHTQIDRREESARKRGDGRRGEDLAVVGDGDEEGVCVDAAVHGRVHCGVVLAPCPSPPIPSLSSSAPRNAPEREKARGRGRGRGSKRESTGRGVGPGRVT
eukprot:126435-Rhodomonas_salina.2